MMLSSRFSKSVSAILSAIAVTFALIGTASAHVKVFPATSTTGAWEEYTMRVPTEKDIPTVKVTLKASNGVNIEQYESIPGWSFSEQKDSSGHVTTATWTATNGGILPGQFQEFKFVAQNPKTPGEIDWDAFQYYKDGSIVEWTGPESSSTPHSITTITAAAKTAPTPAQTQSQASSKQSGTPIGTIVISIVAALLSLISLVVALRRK